MFGGGPRPYLEVVVAEVDGIIVGFGAFFTNFSTFLCKPGVTLLCVWVCPNSCPLVAVDVSLCKPCIFFPS